MINVMRSNCRMEKDRWWVNCDGFNEAWLYAVCGVADSKKPDLDQLSEPERLMYQYITTGIEGKEEEVKTNMRKETATLSALVEQIALRHDPFRAHAMTIKKILIIHFEVTTCHRIEHRNECIQKMFTMTFTLNNPKIIERTMSHLDVFHFEPATRERQAS